MWHFSVVWLVHWSFSLFSWDRDMTMTVPQVDLHPDEDPDIKLDVFADAFVVDVRPTFLCTVRSFHFY